MSQIDSTDASYNVEIECEDGSQPINSHSIISELGGVTESDYEENHQAGDTVETNEKKVKRVIKCVEESSPKKRVYMQKYRKEWETVPTYRPWLSESVLGNLYFYCKFCKNDNKCGKTEIEKHMVSKKHMRNSKIPQLRAQRKFSFRGLLCPVFTPFSIKDVNYSVIPDYGRFLMSCGIKGVLVNDIIGEGMSLTVKERMTLTEEWAKICDKNNQHLMVQVGGVSLRDVQDLVKHAERKKVASIVVLPDLYNRPKDHYDLMRYIKSVSDFAPSMPILYHHNPAYTNLNLDMTKFLNDIIGEIDSFVGIIFTDNDLGRALSAQEVNEDKLTIFLGTDEVILAGVTSGFSSVMATTLNFVPKISQCILDCIKNENLRGARKAQTALKTILDTVSRHGDILPVMKVMMSLLTPINVGSVREPLVGIWQDKINKMRAELQQLQVVAWLS